MCKQILNLTSGLYSLEKRVMYYWIKACEFDRFLPDTEKIYVFSPANPYRLPFQALSRQYWRGKLERKED